MIQVETLEQLPQDVSVEEVISLLDNGEIIVARFGNGSTLDLILKNNDYYSLPYRNGQVELIAKHDLEETRGLYKSWLRMGFKFYALDHSHSDFESIILDIMEQVGC